MKQKAVYGLSMNGEKYPTTDVCIPLVPTTTRKTIFCSKFVNCTLHIYEFQHNDFLNQRANGIGQQILIVTAFLELVKPNFLCKKVKQDIVINLDKSSKYSQFFFKI